MATPSSTFWRTQPGLVWSNPDASDAVHIRAALLRPTFGRLLEIALEFGLERVRGEWEVLQAENTREAERARRPVERILANIREGFKLAATRD